MTTLQDTKKKVVLKALEEVKDPEIPVISVIDMGMITDVQISDLGAVKVLMTPTFVGCPAIEMIRQDIKKKVETLDFKDVEVIIDEKTRWTSNRLSAKGRKALKNFGLAPPPKHKGDVTLEMVEHAKCPHCGSENTTLRSPFGSTLCRAINYCFDCKQGFEQFKPL